jgi:membrane associated rhomboid family serine protease
VRRQVATTGPIATQVLIAVNLTVFVLTIFAGGRLTRGGGDAFADFGLFGPAIAEGGEWYRVITGGFLHNGLIHVGFNMYLLYVLGNMLERGIGTLRFSTLYLTSLIGGSFGALLVSPRALTVGASGAVFGLMGATFVIIRQRGGDPFAGGLGMLIGINLIITFAVSSISIGGHIGGLLTGALVGYLTELRPGGTPMSSRVAAAITLGLGVVLFGAALWAATTWVDPIF